MEKTMPEKPKKNWKLRIALAVGILVFLLLIVGTIDEPIEGSKLLRTRALIEAMVAATQSYIADNGSLPKILDDRGLYDLLTGADSGKVYLLFKTSQMNSDGELVDAWGTPFRVRYVSDKQVGITSAGPDKVFGTADDITNQ